MGQIDLRKRGGKSFTGGFGFVVYVVDEYAQPLVPCAVRVYGTASFTGGLDLNALGTALDSVVSVDPFHDEIRVAVEMLVGS